jgi:hypothetical protein
MTALGRFQAIPTGSYWPKAVRQMVVLTDFEAVRLPPALDNEASRRQLRVASETLRLGVDVLLAATERTVSGSAAKTLFLQNVLDVAALIAR